MNKAASIVSESLLGERFVTIVLKGDVATVYPPTIKILLRAIKDLSKVDVPDKANWIESFLLMPDNMEYMIKALSAIIAGDVTNWEKRSDEIAIALKESTLEDLKNVFSKIVDLIHVDDFFYCAALAKSVARMAAEPR